MTDLLAPVSAALVVAASGWLARPSLDSAFRQLFPVHAKVLFGAALAAVIGVGVVLPMRPALVVAAGIAISVFGLGSFLRWFVGRIRREPPGSRSIVESTRALAHRDFYSRAFDRFGPVTMSTQFGRTVVCIVGIDRGQRLLREHRHAIGPSPLAFSQQMMGGFLRYMDDSTHDVYGPLFRRAMSRSVTDAARPHVVDLTQREFTSAEADIHDLSERSLRLTRHALLRALFGVDPESPFGVEFLDALGNFGAHAIHHRANKSAERDLERVRDFVRKAADSASVAACAISEMRSLDSGQPDSVSVDNLLFMWRIGSMNTAALMVWALQHLGNDAELRSRLTQGEQGLADAVVMESLRLSQSEYVYRRVTKSTVFEGFRLRRGWLVRICVAESHVDPQHYSCPHAFSDRFLGSRPTQSVYAPFGFDRHACNAAGLASTIVSTFLDTLFRDSRIAISPSKSVVRDFRHWSHWRPGSDLSITRARH